MECKVRCLFNDNGNCNVFCDFYSIVGSNNICSVSKKNIMTDESEVKE